MNLNFLKVKILPIPICSYWQETSKYIKIEEEEENYSSLTSKTPDSDDKVHNSYRTSVDVSNQWKSREK